MSLCQFSFDLFRPTPHGVGGLKCFRPRFLCLTLGPTPHGVGGLKFRQVFGFLCIFPSHSPRSGWIEIVGMETAAYRIRSHSPRSGWIEIFSAAARTVGCQSHSPRSGWIEIFLFGRLPPSMYSPTPHGVGGLKYFCAWAYMLCNSVPLPTEWVD